MKKFEFVWCGLLAAALTSIYVFLVSWVMQSGESWFEKESQILTMVAILMLLVFSAAVVGALIFGKPVYLLFAKKGKQALQQLISTMIWLMIILIIVFAFLI